MNDLNEGLQERQAGCFMTKEKPENACKKTMDKVCQVAHFFTMAASYQALASALRDRLAVIQDREAFNQDPAAHFEQLKSVSERITTLQTALPSPIDPQLDHFLKRCSYDKALAFIEQLVD